MRRHLLPELPLLMMTYPGLKPWDLDQLTYGELRTLRATAQKLWEARNG